MHYDEFEQLSKISREEEYNYLCIDRSKKQDKGKYGFCKEVKNTYLVCTPGTNPF